MKIVEIKNVDGVIKYRVEIPNKTPKSTEFKVAIAKLIKNQSIFDRIDLTNANLNHEELQWVITYHIHLYNVELYDIENLVLKEVW